jgi:membrane protein
MRRVPPEPSEPPPPEPLPSEAVAGTTLVARLLAAAERVRVLREQIEGARERHASVDIGLSAIERDSEIGGGLLAGALAYRLFVFLLPLAVFLVVGLGLYADVVDQSPDAVARDLGLTRIVAREIGGAATDSARWWVLLASIPILAYAVAQLFRAISILHGLAYERTGRVVKLRPRSIGLFSLAVLAQIVSSSLVGALADSVLGAIAGIAVGIALVTGIWLAATELFPHGTTTLLDRLPGSLLYGVGTLAVSLFNVLVIGWLIDERQDSYGALGAAAALLFSMYLTGRLIVASAVLNATIWRRHVIQRSQRR